MYVRLRSLSGGAFPGAAISTNAVLHALFQEEAQTFENKKGRISKLQQKHELHRKESFYPRTLFEVQNI